MADERVRVAVKVVDPDTDANEAAVSATGAVMVEVEEVPAAAALADGAGNPTTTIVGAALLGFDGTNWDRIYTVADGDVVAANTKGFLVLGTDGSNYQVIATDASGNVQVDVLSGGGGPEDDDDDIVAGAQTCALGIALTYGWDGTQWERINSDTNGSLDVNVTLALPTGANTIGSIASILTSVVPGVGATHLGKAIDTAVGATDTGVASLVERRDTPAGLTPADGDFTTLIVDSNGRLHVTDPNAGAGSPTGATVEAPALANIAAGATSTGTELRTSDLGGTTKQLAGIDISASAPFKATIIEEDDDSETTKVIALFGKAGEPLQWRPPHKAYFNKTWAANAGFDGWRVEVTNLDNSQTTDFYVTFYYES